MRLCLTHDDASWNGLDSNFDNYVISYIITITSLE